MPTPEGCLFARTGNFSIVFVYRLYGARLRRFSVCANYSRQDRRTPLKCSPGAGCSAFVYASIYSNRDPLLSVSLLRPAFVDKRASGFKDAAKGIKRLLDNKSPNAGS